MEGFTVKNANQFLESGKLSSGIGDSKSISVGNINKADVTDLAQIAKGSGDQSFGDTLTQAIGNVNQLQKTSDKKMQDLAAGRTDNIQEVMVATEKADIGLRLMMQVRNKIIDAYQEIMKMQV